MKKRSILFFLFGIISNNFFLAENLSEEVELYNDGENTYGHYEEDFDGEMREEEDFEISDDEYEQLYED